MYKPVINENIIATLYSREDNTISNHTNIGKRFMCRIISNFSFRDRFISDNMVGRNCSMAIYSTNCPYVVKERDTIMVGGNKLLVDSIELDINSTSLLMSSEYSNKYIEDIAPKIIYLK